MKQREGGHSAGAMISSLLLVGLLGPGTAPAQIFAEEEAEIKPQGKPAAKPDFALTIKDNLISLTAKEASLKGVLEEIGRRMSIEVLALLSEHEKITTEFENAPLEEAIERLIRNYPHVLVS